MSKTKTKKSPVLLFVGVFVVIVIMMFIANQSKDVEVALEMPFNEGIRSLSTHKNNLMAVASDGKTFLWDWDKLDKKPETGSVASEQAYLLGPDVVALIKQGRSSSLVVSNFQGDKIKKSILLDSKGSQGFLVVNRDRSTLAAVTAKTSESEDRTDYQFLNINLERKKASRVANVTDNSSLVQLADFAVSDDGDLFAAAGEKDHRARMVLVDIKKRRVLWDKTYEKPDGFGSVIFAFEGKTVLAGGSDGVIYYIQASDGKIVDRFHFDAEVSIAHDTISVQNLTVSPDETMLAYTYGFNIYVFDHKNKKEIHYQYPGHKSPGPLVFSPDSSVLATSSIRQGGKIRIWPIPQH